jgi:trehalose-6-phosphatase
MCALIEEKATPLLCPGTPTRGMGLLKKRHGVPGAGQNGCSRKARQASSNNHHRKLSLRIHHHLSLSFVRWSDSLQGSYSSHNLFLVKCCLTMQPDRCVTEQKREVENYGTIRQSPINTSFGFTPQTGVETGDLL